MEEGDEKGGIKKDECNEGIGDTEGDARRTSCDF